METLWQITQNVAKMWKAHHPPLSPQEALGEARRFVQGALELTPLQWACDLQEACPHGPKLYETCAHLLNSHCPLSRFTGRRFFWKTFFSLNEATLDPRPESEGLISSILHFFEKGPLEEKFSEKSLPQRKSPQRVLDLGTGTGCLLISLLLEYPCAAGVGVDLSSKALEAARLNAQQAGVAGRITWVESHWLDKVSGFFDCIISNPPYVPRHAPLPPEVALWDPPLALDGGPDGLECYRIFIPSLQKHLAPGGLIALEIGDTQGPEVCQILGHCGFSAQVSLDLAGRPRYVLAQLANSCL